MFVWSFCIRVSVEEEFNGFKPVSVVDVSIHTFNITGDQKKVSVIYLDLFDFVQEVERIFDVRGLYDRNRFEEVIYVYSDMIGFAINIADYGSPWWNAKGDTPLFRGL